MKRSNFVLFFKLFIDSLHMQPESGTLATAKDWRMLSSLDTKKNLPLPTRLLLWLEEHFSCSADSPVWPRQRWKMTTDRRCCDIPIQQIIITNYYLTLETSKASGRVLPFPFFFLPMGYMWLWLGSQFASKRSSHCCTCRVCPVGDSLVAAR